MELALALERKEKGEEKKKKKKKTLYLLIELQPRGVTLTVRVLQPEKPDFTQPHSLHHLQTEHSHLK